MKVSTVGPGIGSFGWFSAGHPTLEKVIREIDNMNGLKFWI